MGGLGRGPWRGNHLNMSTMPGQPGLASGIMGYSFHDDFSQILDKLIYLH
jgi:hypothetical protein